MTLTLILITLLSLGLAGAMSLVAWRALRNERRRSEARVAALAAELADIQPELRPSLEFDAAPVNPSFPPTLDRIPASYGSVRGGGSSGVLQANNMFATEEETDAHSRTPIAIAAGGLIVGTVIVFVALLSTIERPAASAGATGTTVTTPQSVQTTQVANAPGAPTPTVELIALGHNRHADQLTVEGVVRNPVAANRVSHLTALVLLFNGAGTLVATERAPVDASALEPGMESPFAVSVPASDIVRYRVSFRADEQIVPHVDKRNGL